ncbi:MAG: hypothetical protein JKY56_18630 [Kofleriaceae bacterium]|nr:hypothetical protein [Kofleriaceae bacterium]
MQASTWGLLGVLIVSVGCSADSESGSADGGNGVDDSGAGVTDARVGTSDGGFGSPDSGIASPDANISVAGCSSEAVQLIALVNDYRGENGLSPIPASPSLCMVGASHVGDLQTNSPDAPANCNLHSWSDQGTWSACCYTADHAQAQCMWDKPRQLTAYPGNGFENAARSGGTISPTQALNLWKGSPGHNAVILNQGNWASQNWQALGAGMENGYAVLWFGTSVDPAND